ncbi:TSUP family transporter [Rhodobacteraceae bacterium B1Z28]|uniref:Probable membrane transporter protein n=1 Tax=Ruegeria haliotis TaxID=2747601 RepID=A0ABX2PNZ3_9RHOB|nr:TSUP family transporter [Ruegeria haliotis]NVO55856.1 TSUP family transporter [Ruegeria haliotis]
MTVDLSILMLAICLGAMLQVGIGIGFSIVAGPPMMILMGTATAVPALLLLNTIVSVIATDWRILRVERKTITTAIIGCLIGVVLGLAVYPFLSEKFVLALTGALLLIGVVTTLIPLRAAIGTSGFATVSGLSGLATVWAATPGPLMVFGLIAKGRSARDVSKLVQPIALVAYGTAFLLHGLSDWQSIPLGPELWAFVGVTIFGSLSGRVVRPYLPQSLIKTAIRVISLVACYVLLQRAYVMA